MSLLPCLVGGWEPRRMTGEPYSLPVPFQDENRRERSLVVFCMHAWENSYTSSFGPYGSIEVARPLPVYVPKIRGTSKKAVRDRERDRSASALHVHVIAVRVLAFARAFALHSPLLFLSLLHGQPGARSEPCQWPNGTKPTRFYTVLFWC